MALMITDDCTGCDACIAACPNEAITEGDIYKIDPMKCSECVGANDEPQCVIECLADCIVPNPEWRETRDELQEKYNSLH